MGELKNMADKKGKWLRLDIDDTVIAQYMSYKVVPSRFDPSEDAIQYHLKIDDIDKFWTTGSPSVMYQFDEVQKGEMVEIKRLPITDNDGNIIPNKSRYEVIRFTTLGEVDE